jgi:translation initiation factor IF-2
MATTTVKVLAKELKRTAADLLEQLKSAGIEKGSEDEGITEKDKTVLLEYLQKAHGNTEAGTRKKITLIKRENSEIRQADSAGRTRTVQVEVRKKRVLVKAGDKAPAVEEALVNTAKAAPAEAKPILSEEELEKRAAEATRQAELLARQEAEMKAAEDARQKEVQVPAEQEAKSADKASAEKKAQSDKAAKELAVSKEKELAEIRVRRAAAEAEALAIRDMMSAPARVLKAPSEVAADEAKKGTLHKPAKVEGAEDKKKSPAKVGGKTIKSSETTPL